ncbi:MAG: hypothetical protein FWF20_09120 [Betaproteobacteria bacterium]|nr:hypothetical protein [Betaproteobacteria bacterium]MCL2886923.1 hypothetical protein [Betaproteobacteria bacterium]
MSHTPHPSRKLNDLFSARPFQGVDPNKATFLFVGLDANYDAEIESHPIFERVLEYHKDGAAFWRRWGYHHPFLLPEFKYGHKKGYNFHRNFAKIGFSPEHADMVSFIELLHVPTTESKLDIQDLDRSHLQRINSAIFRGNAKYIFVSSGVVDLMRKTDEFDDWLLKVRRSPDENLPVLYSSGNRTVYLHLHFSAQYQDQRKKEEAKAIKALIYPERNPA